ncbi:WD40-repeat-containing domain protein [Circinella umbellata]|nr:WD40-repeat-containing domain protein [Circinella umbellata]
MIQVDANPELLPPFQPVQAIDFGFQDDYVLEVATNSQYAIASASDKLIRLYDLTTLQLATTLKAQEKAINKIKIYNDQYLLSASADGTLLRWDLRTAQPIQTFRHDKPITTFDINCNDTMVVMGTGDFDLYGCPDILFYDTRQTPQFLSRFEESHNDDVTEIQCHPTLPSHLITSSADGLVNYYDVTDFDEQEALLSVVNAGSAVQKAGFFGPDCEYVYSLTGNETFLLHTLEGDLICDYGDVRQLDESIGYAIDCSYDKETQRFYLITGNIDGDVQLLHVNVNHVQHCQTLKAPGGHSDIVRAFHWNHSTQSILTGGEDGRMCAWQANL